MTVYINEIINYLKRNPGSSKTNIAKHGLGLSKANQSVTNILNKAVKGGRLVVENGLYSVPADITAILDVITNWYDITPPDEFYNRLMDVNDVLIQTLTSIKYTEFEERAYSRFNVWVNKLKKKKIKSKAFINTSNKKEEEEEEPPYRSRLKAETIKTKEGSISKDLEEFYNTLPEETKILNVCRVLFTSSFEVEMIVTYELPKDKTEPHTLSCHCSKCKNARDVYLGK